MTMKFERVRALNGTRRFLEELQKRQDVPVDVRNSATWCLRHFPDEHAIDVMVNLDPIEHISLVLASTTKTECNNDSGAH